MRTMSLQDLYKCTTHPLMGNWSEELNFIHLACCLHILSNHQQLLLSWHQLQNIGINSILYYPFWERFLSSKLSFLSYEKVPCTTKNISSGGCSICDPTKHFSHPSFVIYFFFQPTHKTKIVTTNRWEGCNHNQTNQKACWETVKTL
jgi:hypothetical protein